MSTDLIKVINNLSDEDFEKIQSLILELSPKNKRGRPKKAVDESPQEDIVVEEKPVRKRRVQQLTSDDTTTAKLAPVTQSFQKIKNRPNLFLKSAVAKLHKEDSKIDKKLRGDNELEPRGRRVATITVQCNVCGKSENVSPKVVHSAPHEGLKYVCNNCSLRTKS